MQIIFLISFNKQYYDEIISGVRKVVIIICRYSDKLCVLPTFLILLQFHNANNSLQIYVNRLPMSNFTEGNVFCRTLLTWRSVVSPHKNSKGLSAWNVNGVK